MDYIQTDKKYLLNSVYKEGVEPTSRLMFGKELIETFGEEKAQLCLSSGRKIIYKGQEYFIDEAIEEK